VLELKREDITKVVAMASGLESDKDCESCDDTDCEHNPNFWDQKFVVPATKENLRKLEEFLDAITNDGDTKDDGSITNDGDTKDDDAITNDGDTKDDGSEE
jgi:hypothetical protein